MQTGSTGVLAEEEQAGGFECSWRWGHAFNFTVYSSNAVIKNKKV